MSVQNPAARDLRRIADTYDGVHFNRSSGRVDIRDAADRPNVRKAVQEAISEENTSIKWEHGTLKIEVKD